jgi:hypothetical protein
MLAWGSTTGSSGKQPRMQTSSFTTVSFFTKKTVNGKTKLCDAFQEWYNKDVRGYLGKHAKPNQELLCIRSSLLLKEFCQGLATVSTSKNPSLEKTFTMSTIFLQQLDLIERWDIWGEGPCALENKGKKPSKRNCSWIPLASLI